MGAAATWALWMQQHAPDVEGLLARAFGGTGLLRGGTSDYVMALAIACAFPLMRYIMDRRVYGVSCGAFRCLQSRPSPCDAQSPQLTPPCSLSRRACWASPVATPRRRMWQSARSS